MISTQCQWQSNLKQKTCSKIRIVIAVNTSNDNPVPLKPRDVQFYKSSILKAHEVFDSSSEQVPSKEKHKCEHRSK